MERSKAHEGDPKEDMARALELRGEPRIHTESLARELQRVELAERHEAASDDALDEQVEADQVEDRAAQAEPSGFDIAAAVNHVNRNARPSSVGKCATYVRLALRAGGLDVRHNPVAAADYGPFLLARGFVKVMGDAYVAGDVAVMSAFRGRRKRHPYGHVQIFNGTLWVSDFVQESFWPGGDYREAQPPYAIYRWGAEPQTK